MLIGRPAHTPSSTKTADETHAIKNVFQADDEINKQYQNILCSLWNRVKVKIIERYYANAQ